jgi:hypothetical protein
VLVASIGRSGSEAAESVLDFLFCRELAATNLSKAFKYGWKIPRIDLEGLRIRR